MNLRQMATCLDFSVSYIHDLEHGQRAWTWLLIERYKKAVLDWERLNGLAG